MKFFPRTRKGQFGFAALVFVFITLTIYLLGIYPALDSIIQEVMPSLDNTTAAIVRIVPAFLILAILISAWYYVFPQREVVR